MPTRARIRRLAFLPRSLLHPACGLIAFVIVLQSLLSVPLAVQTAARADLWLQNAGVVICSHSADGAASEQPAAPAHPVSHQHCQCQLCQPPTVLLAPPTASPVADVPTASAAEGAVAATGPPLAWTRYAIPLSRAPPRAA